jgi:hypothetical protein
MSLPNSPATPVSMSEPAAMAVAADATQIVFGRDAEASICTQDAGFDLPGRRKAVPSVLPEGGGGRDSK